jgi:hypothetical protein
MELIHLPAFAHLVSSLFPTVFAGCLPRPNSVAGRPVTRLSPRLRYYAAARLLSERRLPLRFLLIGPLTPVPPGDPDSPPEVTPCSSVPCRPQTPCYRGRMSDAFASYRQARPFPLLADRFILGVAPIDYGPVLLLMPFGFHLTVDTLPSGDPQRMASGPPWLFPAFAFVPV